MKPINQKKGEYKMAWIFVDKEGEGSQEKMRQQMRRNMRGGYRYDGSSPMMRGTSGYEHGYRMGYRHGYTDGEEDSGMDNYEEMRRR